jgi:hypothetical protein
VAASIKLAETTKNTTLAKSFAWSSSFSYEGVTGKLLGNNRALSRIPISRKILDHPGMLLFQAVAAIRLVRKQCDGPPS